MDPAKKAEQEVIDTDELDAWYGDEDDEYPYDDEEPTASEEDDEDEDSSPASSEDDDEPVDEDQEPDAAKASGDGTPAKAKQKDDLYAWIDELEPDVRKHAEALAHRERSSTGRVAALTRRLDEMQAQQAAAGRASPELAAKAASKGFDLEEMSDEEVKEFIDEFPQISRSINTMIERRVAKEREEILGQIKPVQENLKKQEALKQRTQLRENAEELFNTAETGIGLDEVLQSPRWREWLTSRSEGYQRFALSAQSVEDATQVLRDFAEYAEAEVGTRRQSSSDQPDSSTADKTAARRKAALKGSTPKSRTAELGDRGNSNSYEDYFNEAVEGG